MPNINAQCEGFVPLPIHGVDKFTTDEHNNLIRKIHVMLVQAIVMLIARENFEASVAAAGLLPLDGSRTMDFSLACQVIWGEDPRNWKSEDWELKGLSEIVHVLTPVSDDTLARICDLAGCVTPVELRWCAGDDDHLHLADARPLLEELGVWSLSDGEWAMSDECRK